MEISKIKEDIMAKYYNPPEELDTVGRHLKIDPLVQAGGADLHPDLVSQLRGDEMLFGLYGGAGRTIAPHLRNKAETEHFEGQLNEGMFISHKFFAVPRSAAEAKLV